MSLEGENKKEGLCFFSASILVITVTTFSTGEVFPLLSLKKKKPLVELRERNTGPLVVAT